MFIGHFERLFQPISRLVESIEPSRPITEHRLHQMKLKLGLTAFYAGKLIGYSTAALGAPITRTTCTFTAAWLVVVSWCLFLELRENITQTGARCVSD